jgi:hypothetical protein
LADAEASIPDGKYPRDLGADRPRRRGRDENAFGIYPAGNTGGSDVWFFKRMPIPDDLRAILRSAKLED